MDPAILPPDLPVPEDDGATDHLPGMGLPNVVLAGTSGTADLGALPGTAILYCYPMTGTPGRELPEGWNAIPGARGCSPQACAFRDRIADLGLAGADHVYGISTQSVAELAEAKQRFTLPYALLSDSELTLARAIRLPTFAAGGRTLLKRVTLIVRDGTVVKVFYPVFPPDRNAVDVLNWLRNHTG